MATSENLKKKVVDGIIWSIFEKGGTQIISFIISVVLARLIMPDQFGMVAMLGVFTGISGIFIDSGFSNALIRKTNRTQADCCTVYWYNILVSIFFYWVLFFCAPLIAKFYGIHELILILRISSLTLIIGSFAGVQRALLNAEMNFKALTKYNLLGLILSGTVGIILAFLDFKVWAIVLQNITSSLFGTVVVFYKVKWKPSLIISKQSFKEFFSYGSKLLASGVLDNVYGNLYQVVIGKIYKSSDLAFYNRAQNLASLTSATPTSILHSITFPALCKLQEDDEKLKIIYRKFVRLTCFIVFPLCIGIGAVAFPLINVVYTETWIFSASLLSIIVFAFMWYPLHSINVNLLIVKGKSKLFLKLEIIKKIQGIIILAASIPLGLLGICWGSVINSILCLIWNTHYTGKFLNMGIFAQLQDILPTMVLSTCMFVGARFIANWLGNDIISLICSVGIGSIIYIGGAYIFKFPEVQELKNIRK